MSSLLDIQRNGRALEITLNQPESKNTLNEVYCRALLDALLAANEDRAVGAVLLKAKGAVFCAGINWDDMAPVETSAAPALLSIGQQLRKPLVAALGGPALAEGLGLVANAHIVLAAHGTTFGLTEIRTGNWPFLAYAALERALGARRTLELALSSKIFNTPEALAWGLIQEVVPSFELDERAEAISQALANASAEALSRGIGFVWSGVDPVSAQAGLLASDDSREGRAAFAAKRRPNWPSHA